MHRHGGILSAVGIALADRVREADRVLSLRYEDERVGEFDALFDEMAVRSCIMDGVVGRGRVKRKKERGECSL